MRSLFLLFTSALLFAQPSAHVQVGYDSIQASRLKADLTFLSSDALEGRRSLERGSEVAIQWIASEFAKAGLKPAAGDSYLQPVPLIEFTPDSNLTTLIVTHNGKSETFRGSDASSTFANEISGSGPVVFAGFGITAPELNYDDYAGIDAKGKIVLIFNHEPQEADNNSVFNGKGNTRYTNKQTYKFSLQRAAAWSYRTGGHGGPRSSGSRARRCSDNWARCCRRWMLRARAAGRNPAAYSLLKLLPMAAPQFPCSQSASKSRTIYLKSLARKPTTLGARSIGSRLRPRLRFRAPGSNFKPRRANGGGPIRLMLPA